jgi:hypothetical protein
MTEAFESCSGLARPLVASSSCTKLKGIIWHSLYFNAICAPLKHFEHSFGVSGGQPYHMDSCKKQLPRYLKIAVGWPWPGTPRAFSLPLEVWGNSLLQHECLSAPFQDNVRALEIL